MTVLRLAFLIPAIADFALAALTFFRMTGRADESLVPQSQLVGVALCWGILLIIAMRKPVERAWVLVPTAMVIACIALAFCQGFVVGVLPITNLVFSLILCGTMIWLCWAGLKYANDPSNRGKTN